MRNIRSVQYLEFGGFLSRVTTKQRQTGAWTLPAQIIDENRSRIFKTIPNTVIVYDNYLIVYVDLLGDVSLLERARCLVGATNVRGEFDADSDDEWIRLDKCAGHETPAKLRSLDANNVRRFKSDCFRETLEIMFFCIGEYFKCQFPQVCAAKNNQFNDFICVNTPCFVVYERSYLDEIVGSLINLSSSAANGTKAPTFPATSSAALADTISNTVVDKLVRVVDEKMATFEEANAISGDSTSWPRNTNSGAALPAVHLPGLDGVRDSRPLHIVVNGTDDFNASLLFQFDDETIFAATNLSINGISSITFSTCDDSKLVVTYRLQSPSSGNYRLDSYAWNGPPPALRAVIQYVVPEMFFADKYVFQYTQTAQLSKLYAIEEDINASDRPETVTIAFCQVRHSRDFVRLAREYNNQ